MGHGKNRKRRNASRHKNVVNQPIPAEQQEQAHQQHKDVAGGPVQFEGNNSEGADDTKQGTKGKSDMKKYLKNLLARPKRLWDWVKERRRDFKGYREDVWADLKTRMRRAEVVISLLTLILLGIYTGATLVSNRLTRTSIEISNKAFVYASSVQLLPEGGLLPPVRIAFDNTGHIASKGLFVEGEFWIYDGPLSDPAHQQATTVRQHFQFGGEDTNIPSGHDNFAIVEYPDTPLATAYNSLKHSRFVNFSVMGDLFFEDGFGHSEATNFCFYYNFEVDKWIPACSLISTDESDAIRSHILSVEGAGLKLKQRYNREHPSAPYK